MKNIRLLSSCVILSLCIGCTSIEYTDKDVTFKRTSFLTQLKIKSIKKTKDGLIVEGYANDQIEGAALLVESAAKGVAQGLKQ